MIQFLQKLFYSQDSKNGMLLKAVANSDFGATKHAIGMGADIEVRNVAGRTPLHVAACEGEERIVRTLISAGANLNAQEEIGLTRLTPVHLAVENNHPQIVRLLLDAGAEKDPRSYRHRTPLFYAVHHRHADIAEILLGHHADANTTDFDGESILHTAVTDPAIVISLLSHGADPNAKSACEETPLHRAVKETAHHRAAKERRNEVISALLKSHANVNAADRDGNTPLHQAVERNRSDVVEILVRHYADPNARNANNSSPLHNAAIGGNVVTTQLLLAHGADYDALNGSGEAPLHLAASHRRPDIVTLLLDAGANKEIANAHGETPLLIAARLGDKAIVEVLLSRGASGRAQDEDGNDWRALIKFPAKVSLKYADCWSYSDKARALQACDKIRSILPEILTTQRVPAHFYVELSLWKTTDNRELHFTLIITGSDYLAETDPVMSVGKVIRHSAVLRTRREIYATLTPCDNYQAADESTLRHLVVEPSARMIRYTKVISTYDDENSASGIHTRVDQERQMQRVAAAKIIREQRESLSD